VRSGLRPQIHFLPLVKHSSKELDVFRTLARVPERSKYRKAACRLDAKWSAAAGRPTSPHLNQNSCPVRFSAVSNGHFGVVLELKHRPIFPLVAHARSPDTHEVCLHEQWRRQSPEASVWPGLTTSLWCDTSSPTYLRVTLLDMLCERLNRQATSR